MKKEDKELLLVDLCARLPYGIFVKEEIAKLSKEPVIYTYYHHPYITECKPYLRPISSMTEEEERNELWFILSEGRTNIELNYNGQLTTKDVVELGFNYPCVCPEISTIYILIGSILIILTIVV